MFGDILFFSPTIPAACGMLSSAVLPRSFAAMDALASVRVPQQSARHGAFERHAPSSLSDPRRSPELSVSRWLRADDSENHPHAGVDTTACSRSGWRPALCLKYFEVTTPDKSAVAVRCLSRLVSSVQLAVRRSEGGSTGAWSRPTARNDAHCTLTLVCAEHRNTATFA
jgi:hypothetical protein